MNTPMMTLRDKLTAVLAAEGGLDAGVAGSLADVLLPVVEAHYGFEQSDTHQPSITSTPLPENASVPLPSPTSPTVLPGDEVDCPFTS